MVVIHTALTGCDPGYGVRMNISGNVDNNSCIKKIIDNAGLYSEALSKNQISVHENKDSIGLFVIQEKHTELVTIYAHSIGVELSCEYIKKAVPLMRNIASNIQTSCMDADSKVQINEVWYQNRCGL